MSLDAQIMNNSCGLGDMVWCEKHQISANKLYIIYGDYVRKHT